LFNLFESYGDAGSRKIRMVVFERNTPPCDQRWHCCLEHG